MAEGTTNGNSLHASPGLSGRPVTTTNQQIEGLNGSEDDWEREKDRFWEVLEELSEYRYWQLERVVRGVEAEKGCLAVERLFPGEVTLGDELGDRE